MFSPANQKARVQAYIIIIGQRSRCDLKLAYNLKLTNKGLQCAVMSLPVAINYHNWERPDEHRRALRSQELIGPVGKSGQSQTNGTRMSAKGDSISWAISRVKAVPRPVQTVGDHQRVTYVLKPYNSHLDNCLALSHRAAINARMRCRAGGLKLWRKALKSPLIFMGIFIKRLCKDVSAWLKNVRHTMVRVRNYTFPDSPPRELRTV